MMQDDVLDASQIKVLEDGVGDKIKVSALNPSVEIAFAAMVPSLRISMPLT